MTGRLAGKVAFITGTAGGQGRAAARLFAAEGALVVGCDLDERGAAETGELIAGAGGRYAYQALDLRVEAAVAAWLAFGEDRFGGVDILYNNAGRTRIVPFEAMALADWAFTFENELQTMFLACRHALPGFSRRGGGVILNTASVAGLPGCGTVTGGVRGGVAHATAKAGVLAFTQALAVELVDYRVRVNALSPGLVETEAVRGYLAEPRFRRLAELAALDGRVATADEVARAALFLVSDEAAHINGANLVIDGGVSAAGRGHPQLYRLIDRA